MKVVSDPEDLRHKEKALGSLTPEEALEAYVTVVKKKLKRHIHIKKLAEKEVTDRVAPNS